MSAQVDRFVHDRLPPAEQLPMLRYDLPELQLPDQLNLVEELLDKAASRPWADRPMLRSPARERLADGHRAVDEFLLRGQQRAPDAVAREIPQRKAGLKTRDTASGDQHATRLRGRPTHVREPT